MSERRKVISGKRAIKRMEANDKKQNTQDSKPKPEPEDKRIQPRIREKDSGFGVLKIVTGIVVALVLVSMFLFNRAGGDKINRGDKIEGERCQETSECSPGTICYSYKNQPNRCMQLCGRDKGCNPGFKCISSTSQKMRKGIRITDICVEDAQI